MRRAGSCNDRRAWPANQIHGGQFRKEEKKERFGLEVLSGRPGAADLKPRHGLALSVSFITLIANQRPPAYVGFGYSRYRVGVQPRRKERPESGGLQGSIGRFSNRHLRWDPSPWWPHSVFHRRSQPSRLWPQATIEDRSPGCLLSCVLARQIAFMRVGAQIRGSRMSLTPLKVRGF